jgi:soluble lytic murein transglycosylase-like protein
MQLTPLVQPWLGVTDPFDIRQNVAGGCRYLTDLKKRFHRTELILAAYNAGPGRVAHLGRIPRIKETIYYVHRVTFLHTRLIAEVRTLTARTRMEFGDLFAFA